MIVAGTGHRPRKIRIGARDAYHPEVHARLVDLARAALRRWAPEVVISGMAQGWDTALAEAALALAVPFHAYVPFAGQESRWPAAGQRAYHRLLQRAARVVVVCGGGYSAAAMQLRNERMVDDSDLLLALWNGTPGGTRNCLDYAAAVGRASRNLWPHWARHAGPRPSAAGGGGLDRRLLAPVGGVL